MNFTSKLISGRLVKRYKRFLADVELDDGQIVTAHCANPGSMLGLKEPGVKVWLSISDNPKRKLKYSWELLEFGKGTEQTFVGINTAHPNRIVEAAILTNKIPELEGYGNLRREVKYGKNSRIDLLLEDDTKPPCYVEVKNVHFLRETGLAEFPDSVTKRGTKHLVELADMVAEGSRSVMVYLVQRTDAQRFRLASDIDPEYARTYDKAHAAGVEAICYDCDISVDSVNIGRSIPIETRT